MENAFKQIIPEVPFAAEIRVAEAWGSGVRSFEQSHHLNLLNAYSMLVCR